MQKTETDFITVLIYIDDLLITGNSLVVIESLKHFLHAAFTIKDLEDAHLFLEKELVRSPNGIVLFQRKYALDLIIETGLLHAKMVSSPTDPNIKLHSQGSDFFHDPTAYRRLVGRLVYLTNTKLDLSYSVGLLSQFLDKPLIPHYNAALHVLRFVNASPALGLFFSQQHRPQTFCFC